MSGFDALTFFESLKHRLTHELPGSVAHEPLRAVPLSEQALRFKNEGLPKPGAVLILLCDSPGNLWFPLIKRTDNGGIHSGQISLPGGRSEKGEDHIQTAIREAEEEIGVNRNHFEVLGTLSPFHVIPSHYLVTPVVARWTSVALPVFKMEEKEVAGILNASLSELLKPNAIQYTELNVRGYRINAPHFNLEGEVVWGATAMMLNELRMVCNAIPDFSPE